MTKDTDNPYNKYMMHMVVKLLTNLDRDRLSPTYGSFDRNYWNYHIRDFSSALLQQSGLTLALAYKNNFPGNVYYNDETIKDYAIASVDFWKKLQNSDGSFPEYWPHESSIASTCFSLYAICETIDILKIKKPHLLKSIRKAAEYLLKNSEYEALNQEMASIAAIYYAGKILNDNNIIEKSNKKFSRFSSKINTEGWFSEYGGVDVGYLTVTLDFLIRFHEISKKPNILVLSKKILHFLKYFVHPDGSFGGEYCTRNTEYFLPYGFEYMKKYDDIVKPILDKLNSYVNKDYLNSVVDERYVLHYISASYMKSLLRYNLIDNNSKTKYSKIRLPYEEIFEKTFKNAMIYVKSSRNYYFICSFMKGGVFKVMDKKNPQMYTDSGLRFEYKSKKYVSEWPFDKNSFKVGKNTVMVKSRFTKFHYFRQTPLKRISILFFSIIFKRKVVDIAKKFLIFNNNKEFLYTLDRSIDLSEKTIFIKDNINIPKKAKIERMYGLSVRHTASSRFFQVNTLGQNNAYRNKLFRKISF